MRYKREQSKNFEKGKAMNTMNHSYSFKFISDKAELFCIAQKGIKIVRSDKDKMERDNCVFMKDNP